MRLLIKDRGKGKTTGLIYTSEATGYPIATGNKQMIENIKQMAKQMGCNIPEPITYIELRGTNIKSNPLYNNVLCDEVWSILPAALSCYLNCNVITATMTDYLKEKKNM